MHILLSISKKIFFSISFNENRLIFISYSLDNKILLVILFDKNRNNVF